MADSVQVRSQEDLDWLKKNIGSQEIHVETFAEKFKRKFSENPFVPLGCVVTAACLSFGLYSFQQGKKRQSQLMMRGRILAQGFTVVALCSGIAFQAAKKKPEN